MLCIIQSDGDSGLPASFLSLVLSFICPFSLFLSFTFSFSLYISLCLSLSHSLSLFLPSLSIRIREAISYKLYLNAKKY